MKNKKKSIIIGVVVLLLAWFGFKTALTVVARDYAKESQNVSYEKIDIKYSEPTGDVIHVGNIEMENKWNLKEEETEITHASLFKSDDIYVLVLVTPKEENTFMEDIVEEGVSEKFLKKHELDSRAKVNSYVYSYDDPVSTLSTFYPLPKLLDEYRSVKCRALLVPVTLEHVYETEIGTDLAFICMRQEEFGGAYIDLYAEDGSLYFIMINDDSNTLTEEDILDFVSTIKYLP